MCGICGVINKDHNKLVDKNILTTMVNSLLHRGPDDEGSFVRGNVGLGMRRLSIIDVKGGHQPIFNEDRSVSMVCNGEIYNYLELREGLEKRGHTFTTHSDVEVIVHLYEEDPDGFMDTLRGMFAIAIYDMKREKLLLVRDRLGIKPLYYTYQNGVFLFGSELKAILAYPEVRKQISFKALSDYLTYLYIPAPDTIYEDIYKLPPAYVLTFSRGDIALKQYWEIDYTKDSTRDEAYYVERLRDLMREAVKMHMISEVPLGAFLSGGMDSSTIVALMSEITGTPVKTFSVGFDVPGFNELNYARAVADKFGTKHHEISLKPDIIGLLPKIVAQFDEPFADSSAIPTYLISEFAKRNVTVCLAGDGGDELFAGYGWTRRQKFIEDYHRLPRAVRAAAQKVLVGSVYEPDRKAAALDKIRRFVYDAGLDAERSFLRRRTCFPEEMKRRLFNSEAQGMLGCYESGSRLAPFFSKGGIDDLEKLLLADTKMYLPEDGLCKVDRMSMAHSLEVRVPFLDHKVVEFAAAMPFQYKMRGFKSKYILKKMMRDALPPEVLRQRKLGFTIPLNSWFRRQLKDFTRDLFSANCRISRIINVEYVRWLLDQHAAGCQDFGNQIYALAVLELWMRSTT